MDENDDVQLVESISGIDGTPLTSNVMNVYIHGSIGVSSTIATSIPIASIIVLNFAIIVSNSAEVQIQQLVVIQVQAIAWKPHNWT